jgi:uncharacterized protein YceK
MEEQGLPNERRYMRIVLGLVVLLVLGGCGSSTPQPNKKTYEGRYEGTTQWVLDGGRYDIPSEVAVIKDTATQWQAFLTIGDSPQAFEGACIVSKTTGEFFCSIFSETEQLNFIGPNDGKGWSGEFTYNGLGTRDDFDSTFKFTKK